jgi:hypothetical protein
VPDFTPAECREILFRVAKLRLPDTRKRAEPVPDEEVGGMPASPGQMKVHALEGYMTDCAIARGEAEEAALYMQAAVKSLEDQWDAIEGWETLLPPQKERTEKSKVEAKRTLKPELYDGIREGKWLADKLKTQVRRLERDEETCSRVYTMTTGS